MLVELGKRTRRAGIADLLVECHQRIRSFSGLAVAIGEREGSSDELREACARCRRYFTEALPLHVADEEQSILPRLRGKDAELDAALDAMHAEHEAHAALIAALIEALDRVAASPTDQIARRGLAQVAGRLGREFEQHLAAEERLIIPKVSSLLTNEEQERALAELRARRQLPGKT